jgi:hypothetical protein
MSVLNLLCRLDIHKWDTPANPSQQGGKDIHRVCKRWGGYQLFWGRRNNYLMWRDPRDPFGDIIYEKER